jgi:hypothetical protein
MRASNNRHSRSKAASNASPAEGAAWSKASAVSSQNPRPDSAAGPLQIGFGITATVTGNALWLADQINVDPVNGPFDEHALVGIPWAPSSRWSGTAPLYCDETRQLCPIGGCR